MTVHWVLDHPLVGSSLEKNRFSLSGQPVLPVTFPLWVGACEVSPTYTLAYQLVLSYAGLVEATIFLRFHGCSSTIMPKRQYSTVGLLVIWLLKSFCPHFHDFPWDLDVGVTLSSISWACGSLSFSLCWLAVGLYHSLWLLQKKRSFFADG